MSKGRVLMAMSGGIDSTLIASLAKKVHSWTVGFDSLNEFEWGKLGADFIGTSHYEVLVDEENFISSAISMINKRKEPLSVPNEVLLYEMTKQVKNKKYVYDEHTAPQHLFLRLCLEYNGKLKLLKLDGNLKEKVNNFLGMDLDIQLSLIHI